MEKQVAFITGASGGIGRAIAMRLADMGFDLFITGRNEEKLKVLTENLEEKGVSVAYDPVDLADEQAVPALNHAFLKNFGRLDVLVNNAGMAVSKPFEEVTVEDWDLIMKVNAQAPFFLTQALVPMMKKRGKGVIINVSSVVGRLGYPKQSAYGASKHAMHGFSKALAKELQPYNIRVHVVAPGGVDTELVERMRPDIDKDALMRPGEIAEIVGFLVQFNGNAVIDEINVRRKTSQPW
jgi:3-oxoacyl-[acyl-carrier protein] reductase